MARPRKTSETLDSIEECQEAAYELADQVIVPNRMIRDDIGRTTEEEYGKLEKMGLLSEKEEEAVV